MEVDDYLPLSGLQHLVFCERQCALIHVEGVWAENRQTLEGRSLHERVDQPASRRLAHQREATSVAIRSDRLRLFGKADLVEFRAEGPYPVEFKRGRRYRWKHNEVQLCAQAICLEEMLGREVRTGAIFYARSKRRIEVIFDDVLRQRTEAAAQRFHELVRGRVLPPAVFEPKCRRCSLATVCMPNVERSAVSYLAGLVGENA
ncbi:MAG: CRISPR-associated protein Cas4 [Planctomycetes bacterium]|nr:CRISPR-associated protein Cas4 [Planctomycetota bacterium]MBI3843132.1 CRISPR-associated protein Cas4 [Planctomycetota bacterium]